MVNMVKVVDPFFIFEPRNLHFSLVTSDSYEKSSPWLWKEKFCQYWCEKARKHIHDNYGLSCKNGVKLQYKQRKTNKPESCRLGSCPIHKYIFCSKLHRKLFSFRCNEEIAMSP